MHGYAGADAPGVVALAEEEVHTADGKLETRLVGAGDGRESLGLRTTGSALACLTRPASQELPSALTSSLLSRLRVQTGSPVFLPRRPAPSAWALALFSLSLFLRAIKKASSTRRPTIIKHASRCHAPQDSEEAQEREEAQEGGRQAQEEAHRVLLDLHLQGAQAGAP